MSKTNVKTFHKSLHDNGYLCTENFADKVYCALRKKPMSITMLIGQAGTGKSFLPETLGDVLKCNVYVKQAYQGMDWDEFVRKHIPDENTKSGIKSIDAELLRAVQESKKKQVILLLDEWDKTRISSDSYFLDFLQTGRISVSGQKYQANLDNLIIFFTSNNERDISEPLLRRVKVIEVEHLPVSLVAKVLKGRYKDDSVAMSTIEPVLKLYDTSVMSKMDKPATIQELCDLINDWVTYNNEGKQPDWEELIYTNVTKNERNHLALQKEIERDKDDDSKEKFSKKINTDFFNESVVISEDGEVVDGFMPRMVQLRDFDTVLDAYTGDDDDSDVFVEIKRDEETYTTAFIEAQDDCIDVDVPHFVGWNRVKPDRIQRSKPYLLRELVDEYPKFKRMRNSDGVIVFTEHFADKDDVLGLIELCDGTIRKGTDDEIIFRFYYVTRHGSKVEANVRWKHLKGCEFIVPTQMIEMLYEYIRDCGWYQSEKYQPVSNLHQSIKEGSLRDSCYIHLRRLGNTKHYLDITVQGMHTYNDNFPEHLNLVDSGEAKVKETARTTVYDMGWAVVRSWHKKDSPNYKSNITIKDVPPANARAGMAMINSLIGTNNRKMPLFINVDKEQFDKCDRDKWQTYGSSRMLRNANSDDYNMYAVNTYDRTTFMLERKDKDGMDNMFKLAKQLRAVRDKTLEVLC